MLRRLNLYLEPETTANEQSLDMLQAMLSSWNARVSLQTIHLSAFNTADFTRQAYIDLLHVLGQVLDGWFHDSHSSPVPSRRGGEISERLTARKLFVNIFDWEIWEDWWWAHVQECFPVSAKSGGLQMSYDPRECSSNMFCAINVATHPLYFISG